MNKYRAKGQRLDGKFFASKKELRRYNELKLLQRAGEIKELTCQPTFKFDKLKYDSGRTPSYRADYSYIDKFNKRVVEDVKSVATKTQLYKLKKALMKHFFDIDVREV